MGDWSGPFILFLATMFVAAVFPGPATLLCLAHGVRHGARRTWATACGITAVSMLQAGISLVGLGALLAASETLFTAVRLAGAAYLVYLGARMLLVGGMGPAAGQCRQGTTGPGPRRPFMQGAYVAAGNPKAILFFGALFPQCIPTGGVDVAQGAGMLGAVAMAGLSAVMLYAYAGGFLMRWLASPLAMRRIECGVGGTFVVSGLVLAASER